METNEQGHEELTDEQVVAVIPAILEQLKKTPRRRTFYATQAAEPSILEHTPRIVRGEQEHLFVHLGPGPETHPDDVYPVQRVTHLLGADLVTITTKTAVFLMTDKEYTRSIPEEEQQEERDARELIKDADELIAVYANNRGGSTMPAVTEALYSASGHLIESSDATQQRVGYVLALDAFLASPGALEQAVRNLRTKLVASDPDLAMLGSTPVTPEQVVPLAVCHQINGEEFSLEPDGTLTCVLGDKLAPRDVFDLLTFFRMPGVAALIDRAEIERQTQTELEWQEAKRQEMTRAQARALLETDEILMRQMEIAAAHRFIDGMNRIKAEEDAAA